MKATGYHARAINPQGYLSLIDDFDESIMPFKQKSITLSQEMMLTRSLFRTEAMVAQHRLLNEVSALVDAGVLRSTLSQIIGPIDAAHLRQAHAKVASGHAIGKIVLQSF